MFSTTSRKSQVLPANVNPLERLMYAVATRAVLDLLKKNTPLMYRQTAQQFIRENIVLFINAGIPEKKINMLLQQNGVDAVTSTPAGASR